jgi:hypothetical protein
MEAEVLGRALAGSSSSPYMRERLQDIARGEGCWALHVSVMQEPYLSLLLGGRKTVESRFSINRVCPFESVAVGDVLALKMQSGPIVGLTLVEHVAFYELEPAVWRSLQERYAGPLCAEDPEFWRQRERARYATLMRVRDTELIVPVPLAKRDRRGWVRLAATAMAQQRLAM